MQTERQKIATSIKEFRSANSVNQMDFSEECGISRETLSLIERGETNVTLDTLDLIAVRMGIPISELLAFKYSYFLCSANIVVENEEQKSYGIGVIEDHCLIDMVSDVSGSKEKVAFLVELCNRLRLSPMHLRDVIEDFFLS